MKDDPERTPEADKGVEAESRLWRKKGVSDPSEVLTLFCLRMIITLIRPRHSIHFGPIPNPIAISEHIMHLSIFPYRIHATNAQTAVIFRSLPYPSGESSVSESRGWPPVAVVIRQDIYEDLKLQS